MTSRASKLLIEAGIIPENTMKELANWRLLPQDSVESHGTRPVRLDTNKEEEVQEFITDLGKAIAKDMADIHETELDHAGGFKKVSFDFGGSIAVARDTFIDRFDRLILPFEPHWDDLQRASVGGGEYRKVLKKEPRFEGEQVVALVVYLERELEETTHAATD